MEKQRNKEAGEQNRPEDEMEGWKRSYSKHTDKDKDIIYLISLV